MAGTITTQEISTTINKMILVSMHSIGTVSVKQLMYYPLSGYVVTFLKDQKPFTYYEGNDMTLAAKYYNQIDQEFFPDV